MDPPNLIENLKTNPSFILESKLFQHIGAEINDVHTDFLWADFENCLVLAVTQYKKIGSLALIEPLLSVSDLSTDCLYDIKPLLGSNEEENLLIGRYLAESFKIKKPLYIFANLKEHGIQTVRAVKDIFADILTA